MPTNRILIIVTNVSDYEKVGFRTGLWLGEMTHFWDVAAEAGYQMDIASPSGGYVPLDPESLAASVLKVPIREFKSGDYIEVTCWSQSNQAASALPVFHYMNLMPVFKAAVDSFFQPARPIKNLFFAIEWFSMDAPYSEGRLVNAMTALENIIENNLEERDALILPRSQFEKTRRHLRKIIGDCLANLPSDASTEALTEINEKLTELNRRSLLRKLDILAERWQVPIHDIGPANIRAAKQARDRIVHRGQYFDPAATGDADLWAHVTVIREIAARFLLTAIGFKGRYISYIGGYHDADFPPTPAE